MCRSLGGRNNLVSLSKSGWVTTRAAATLPRRTALQVMACQMGIHVVKVGSAIHDQEDERN